MPKSIAAPDWGLGPKRVPQGAAMILDIFVLHVLRISVYIFGLLGLLLLLLNPQPTRIENQSKHFIFVVLGGSKINQNPPESNKNITPHSPGPGAHGPRGGVMFLLDSGGF